MDLTCIECGYVGDIRTHFDIPHEPGHGICKDLDECRRRQKVREIERDELQKGL